ncbi:hypothetical protein Clacol_009171 [Clathrus columnatus]|uniref:Protein kinase domain-containing protein n=1 Tax=Clathrus columnatus TaxID=1419009 RepID=A0AAV5ARB6_9AGAM|nr:hypothetical protein Clacol_009171 [Clathrus columnatus]
MHTSETTEDIYQLVVNARDVEKEIEKNGAKNLSADATKVNGTHELKILSKLSEREVDYCEPLYPRPFSIDANAFRASAPNGRLSVHLVKPIVACTLQALQRLHSRNIIHADIKASNFLFFDLGPPQIERIIARDPPSYSDVYVFNGNEYPTLETQPLQSVLSWVASAFDAETIQVVLSGLGTALCSDSDEPNLSGNIGTFALRAPEVIIRAQCGKEIDIWAIGCMTYELLTGQTLFRPLAIPSLTPNESLLLLQLAVTGETLSKDVIGQSCVRDKFFDREGFLIHSKENIYLPQSIKARLTELCKDTKIQINAAAKFINDCLRLNPHDRPTVDRLALHPWLSTAFRGGVDNEDF